MNMEETIAAISTPLGEGGIGIVRVSGEEAFSIGRAVFIPGKRRKDADYPRSHHLYHGYIATAQGARLDEVLVAFMRAPHTYTREDVVEINCHSGIFTLRLILRRVLEAGARLARPGEFTQRAFLKGRIDLSQAESTLKMIRARSEEAVKIAAANMGGRLSQKVSEIRERMLNLWARMEAQFDFPEDLEEDAALGDEARAEMSAIREALGKMARTAEKGWAIQEGLASAIAGKPNAGKSSLLNALLREQRAIVHELPGTTRDLLEGYLTVGGYPLRLIDTAGIHGTRDPVERAGIEKTRDAVAAARLLILVLDGSVPWSGDDQAVAELIRPGQLVVVVINKIDLPAELAGEEIERHFSGHPVVRTSATGGLGLERLEQVIVNLLDSNLGAIPGESPLVVDLRHARVVEEAREGLERALGALSAYPLELAGIDLREAWKKLGEITGETVSEELLEKIFSEFCIGK